MLARAGPHGAANVRTAVGAIPVSVTIEGKCRATLPPRRHLITQASFPPVRPHPAPGLRMRYAGESPSESSRRTRATLAGADDVDLQELQGGSAPSDGPSTADSWTRLQRFDADGGPVFTPAQHRLFGQIAKALRDHRATRHPRAGLHRGPPALALYRYAIDLVSPKVDHGQPELNAMSLEERIDESTSWLPDEASTLECNGDLSIPTWASLLKNAAARQNGFAFRVLLDRCLMWCAKQQSQTNEEEDAGPPTDLLPISEQLEDVQTVPQLRMLLISLIIKLRNIGVIDRRFRPDLSMLGDSGSWQNFPDFELMNAQHVIAVLKSVAPPAPADRRTIDEEGSAFNWDKRAGAFSSYRHVSVEAQRQCQVLFKIARRSRYGDLDYPTLVERYRQMHDLKWDSSRGGKEAERYSDPFNLLGSPDDPFSAVSVIIAQEKLFRWAKVKYGEYDVVDASDESPGEDRRLDQSSFAVAGTPLNVPLWLFYAVLRMMSDTGRTASLRNLIRTYLQSYMNKKQAPKSHYFPNFPVFEPLSRPDDPIPASHLLNLLIKSHRTRGTNGAKFSSIVKDAWRDICVFCLAPHERPKGIEAETSSSTGRKRRRLPLLSPNEDTIIALYELLPKRKSATHDFFGIVEKMEAYFGRRTAGALPMTGWGKSVRRGGGEDGQEIQEWVYQQVDHPGMTTNPDLSHRNVDSRPYMISFTIATARRLLYMAHSQGFGTLAKRALLLSRRWAAQGREQSIYFQAKRELKSSGRDKDGRDEDAEVGSVSVVPFNSTPQVQELLARLPWDMPPRHQFWLVVDFLRENPYLIQSSVVPRLLMTETALWYNCLRTAYRKGHFDPMPEPRELREIEAEMERYGESIEHHLELERYSWDRRSEFRAGKALLSRPDSVMRVGVRIK